MSFEVHDEGTAAQQLVQKAVGQGVLVHPVGGASFSDRRKFRNFLQIAPSVWLHQFQYRLWAGNDLGRCEPTELQEAVQGVAAFASEWEASTCRCRGKPLPASVKKSNAQESRKFTKNLGDKGALAGVEPKCRCSKSRAQTRLCVYWSVWL